jgi:hypothetical protein
VYRLPADGGVPPKHVAVNKTLHCYVCRMYICRFCKREIQAGLHSTIHGDSVHREGTFKRYMILTATGFSSGGSGPYTIHK